MTTLIDLADNPQTSPITGDLLGFSGVDEALEVLGLDIYDFLYLPIRQADQRQGQFFVKRYLQGPQAAWGAIVARARALPNIWSITEATDETLQFLKNIVGWTAELAHVTDRLDALQLRRLIASSAAIWNEIGPEDSWLDVVFLLTGARSRVYSWFDFRFILDESGTSEEHDGRDPWTVSLPGPPNFDEYRSNVRIVDDGTGDLDRQLVLDVLEVMRPTGERIEVSWISFLDLFETDGDRTQWVDGVGGPIVVDGGEATLDDVIAETSYATAPLSAIWSQLTVFARVKGVPTLAGQRFGIAFYSDGVDDEYRVGIDVLAGGGGSVNLTKVVAGVETLIASAPPIAPPLFSGIHYGIRVDIVPEGATNRIRVFLDGSLVINTTDNAHVRGTLGVWHDAGATIVCDEVEMFLVPMTTDIIGPGT